MIQTQIRCKVWPRADQPSLAFTVPVPAGWVGLICLMILLFAVTPVKAATAIFTGESLLLGNAVEYIEDRKGEFNIRDLLNQHYGGSAEELLSEKHDPLHRWNPSESKTPNFGYTDSVFWFRTTLKNRDPSTSDFYLSMEYPLVDRLDVYLVRDGTISKSYLTGDTLPFDSRPVSHRKFLIPLSLSVDDSIDVWMRVQTEGAMQLPLKLAAQSSFYMDDQIELAFKMLYYGMMIIMLLYNLFLYMSVRERAYLYYVGFVFSFAVMQASMHGVLFQYFYPGSPQLHHWVVLFIVPSTMTFACLFANNFLNLKQCSRLLHLAVLSLSVLGFMSMAGAFVLDYSTSTRVSVLFVLYGSILMLVSGPVAWVKSQHSARYFTAAWCMLLIGTTSTALSKFGILPSNGFTESGLMYGSALEALLLRFALADRLNRERNARFVAQKNELHEAQQRQVAEERLLYQSTHDAVTGVPNLVLLTDRLQHLVSSESHQNFALVSVRLNRLDEVSKTLGQAYNNQILLDFSARIDKAAKAISMAVPVTEKYHVARTDVNTFTLILAETEEGELLRELTRLQVLLSRPIELSELRLDCGVLIGASCYPLHARNADDLLKQANIAIDIDIDRGGISIFDPQLNPYNERRLSLMGELRDAIEQNHLSLNFQPQLELSRGCVHGVEALVRWIHPVYGYIPPMEFVMLAEQTGLIRELTCWVLEHAIAAGKRLNDQGYDLDVSVNISAANLHEVHFVQNVRALLAKHGMKEERLKLEITETAVMLNPENAMKVLGELDRVGVKISVDDFGTGHSSLSYIRRLPATEIKIDRSFVMDMANNKDDEIIVSTTINMCHNLGYKVVAEGIEDLQTLSKLESLRCDIGQGYYFSKPLSYSDLENWLFERNQPAAIEVRGCL